MKGSLGKFLRKLRVDHDEYLKDMANRTGVSIAYLSAIENETKKVSDSLIEKIVSEYGLSGAEEFELRMASMEANKEATIYLENLSEEKIDLTCRFARRIEAMDSETLAKIKEVLKEDFDD